MSENNEADRLWDQVYEARKHYFESRIGKLPDSILKLGHMFGVWPGGGLFVIPATRLGPGYRVYTTFGFTNPDMPASLTVQEAKVESEGQRITRTESTLRKKEPVVQPAGRAGYGYEILMVTPGEAEWPLWFLQWVANAEILNDVDLLGRVEEFNGLTVQDVRIGETDSIHVLITKTRSPLPEGTELPNGRMELLVATVITADEMEWSMQHGKEALLQKLVEAGVGQVSILNRSSIFSA